MNTNTQTKEAERQLVIFSLANESYGVDIGTVNEIIRMQDISRVPRAPNFVQGVINLRGKVIPVVDLRKVFCLPAGETNRETRIVVVDILEQHVGIMVDAVTEVLRISADAVEPPASMITTGDADYLLGIAKLDHKLITLLDLSKVFSRDQAKSFEEADLPQTEKPTRPMTMARA
ncbi:MAG: chemotaxis protein CheW [Dehalococcoidia bacterium]|nr:chemotaxis protein CheW [Dehalococcoidia bacterium]